MYLKIENPYIIIVIVFLSVIACLVVFALLAEATHKIVEKKNSKPETMMDVNNRKAKIYQIIYENNGLTFDVIVKYFNVSEDKIKNELNEMIKDKKLLFVDNKYIINKNEE